MSLTPAQAAEEIAEFEREKASFHAEALAEFRNLISESGPTVANAYLKAMEEVAAALRAEMELYPYAS